MNHLCEAPVEAVNGEDAVERLMCTLSSTSASAANGPSLRSSFGGEEIPMSATSHPSNDRSDVFVNRHVRTDTHGIGSPSASVTGEGSAADHNNLQPIGFTPAASAITTSPLPRFVDTFDAILMDSVMPVMTGPEATVRIRALGYTGLILGVTGNALPEDIEMFTKCGANAVLTKPVNTDLLVKLLTDLQ
jgi:CheY-like chemotaxis protein